MSHRFILFLWEESDLHVLSAGTRHKVRASLRRRGTLSDTGLKVTSFGEGYFRKRQICWWEREAFGIYYGVHQVHFVSTFWDRRLLVRGRLGVAYTYQGDEEKGVSNHRPRREGAVCGMFISG